MTETIAERTTELVNNTPAMERALADVIQQYPDLTRGGLGHAGETGPFAEAHDEIMAALGYMALCRESRTAKAGSYGMKHRAENWAKGYIANGSMIVAALMAGAQIQRQSLDSPNAYVLVTEPRKCWRNENCRGLVPVDSTDRICQACRLKDTENPHRDQVAIAAREKFWVWVGNRKAGDNPRGDFIRDTREILSADTDPDHRLGHAVSRAQKEHDLLWRRYASENGMPENLVLLHLCVDVEEEI